MTASIPTVVAAVEASRALDLETVGAARDFAESLGYESFRTGAPMPAEFAAEPFLHAAFADGVLNARCEYEQVRAGLL